MKIVLVIVYYSGIDELKSTIDSIPPRFCEIIVVDASPRGEAEQVCQYYDSASWLEASRNGGYAWGMNRGVAYASEKYADSLDVVILSNPDVLYSEMALLELTRAAASSDGVCYPLQIAGNGDVLSHSALSALGRSEMITGWLLPFRIGKSRKQANQVIKQATATPTPVKMPPSTAGSGACVALSYGAWKLIGGMDERFFLFSEDRMLAATAHRESIAVSLCGSARIVHEGGFKARGVSMLQLSEYLASQRFAWCALWPTSLAFLKVAQIGGLLLRALRSYGSRHVGEGKLYLRLARLANSKKLESTALTGEDGVRLQVLERYPELVR